VLPSIAGAALVAAAVLLALFAQDVRAWRGAFAGGDARAAAGLPTQWRASTSLPAGWSEAALGLRSQRALRLAITAFQRTYATPPGFDSGLAAVHARDAAEAALAARAGDADAARASQALDLLGLLLFGDSTNGAGSAAAVRAVSDLDRAVEVDPANADAKANLELVVRLLRTNGERVGPNAGVGPRSHGHRGAAAGATGEGY
jgi:hypothetical protein